MFVRLLTEDDAMAHRALRTMSVSESAQFSCPEIVRELAIYLRIGCGVLAGHLAGGTRVWGVFDRSRLLGTVSVSRAQERANAGKAYLWGLYVLPEARGSVASDALMSAALAWCRREAHLGEVNLHAHCQNLRALRWFERYGFERQDDPSLRTTMLVAMRARLNADGQRPDSTDDDMQMDVALPLPAPLDEARSSGSG